MSNSYTTYINKNDLTKIEDVMNSITKDIVSSGENTDDYEFRMTDEGEVYKIEFKRVGRV